MTTNLAARPTVTPPPPYTFPSPCTWVLGNGLTVEYYPSRSRLVTLTLLTTSGTLTEPAGSEGVATVAASLRDEGTAGHTGEEFAAALDQIGARYRSHVTDGATVATMQVPEAGLAAALGLLAETAISATYPDHEFERVRATIREEARSAHLSPGGRANSSLRAACFRPEDRSSVPDIGTARSLATLTLDDVTSFDRGNLLPTRATLLVGGHIDDHVLDQLLASTFAEWQATDRRASTVRTAAPGLARIIVVDRPGSVQTEIRFGLVGPGPSDPRHAALRTAVHVLGGSMNSRLSAELRERKGYTYGIGAGIRQMPGRGLFTIATSVDTPSTGPAVADIVSIVDAMRAAGITDAECSGAIDELLLGAPLEYQTAAAIVNQRATHIAQQLPQGWLNDHRAALETVSAADASTAFAEVVSPSSLCATFVGDAKTIMPALTGVFDSSDITVESL
jgi:predicted Zn-dependent peptidase